LEEYLYVTIQLHVGVMEKYHYMGLVTVEGADLGTRSSEGEGGVDCERGEKTA